MLRIIDLLNKKVRLIKQIMKLSLEEENQIFVPENDDASKIIYHQTDLLPNHKKGANTYDDDDIKDMLQHLFLLCDTNNHLSEIIDIETVYNRVLDILNSQKTFFGNIFEKI